MGYFYPIILDPVLIPVQVQSDLVLQGCLFLFLVCLSLPASASGLCCSRSAQPTGASCEAPSIAVITSTISSIVPLFPRYLAYFSPTSKNSPQLLSPPTSSLLSPLFSSCSTIDILLPRSPYLSLFCIVFGQTRRATPTRDTILVLHTLELFGTRHPSSQVPTSRLVIPYLLQSSLAGLAPILESSYNHIPCDLLPPAFVESYTFVYKPVSGASRQL